MRKGFMVFCVVLVALVFGFLATSQAWEFRMEPRGISSSFRVNIEALQFAKINRIEADFVSLVADLRDGSIDGRHESMGIVIPLGHADLAYIALIIRTMASRWLSELDSIDPATNAVRIKRDNLRNQIYSAFMRGGPCY